MNVEEQIDLFTACVIRDAINHATAAYWERRADAFEKALPHPGDYLGRSTGADRAERERRLRTRIRACRNAARLWRHIATGEPLELLTDLTERQAAA